jgi:IQ calmodulin-binding motif
VLHSLLQITETYTPPPPSNFGLPDDGRSYQYSTFPKLDPNLYGKIRAPMKWTEQNLRASMRNIGRRTSTLARANEQAVVEKATRSLLNNVTKRGTRNLENALKALSSPFNPTPKRANNNPINPSNHRSQNGQMPSRERSFSAFSNVTLPSDFDPVDDMALTSAEEVVLNARRKQAILIAIVIKFQAHCRVHLLKKRLGTRIRNLQNMSSIDERCMEKRKNLATSIIQSWYRTYMMRRRFSRAKAAVVLFQSRRRGRVVLLAYRVLIQLVSNVQALSRGVMVRRTLAALARERMNQYKQQIVLLWNHAFTPLSYRSQFWPILNLVSYIRLTIAEQELVRLWNELRIPTSDSIGEVTRKGSTLDHPTGIQLGIVQGKSYLVHQTSRQVRPCDMTPWL